MTVAAALLPGLEAYAGRDLALDQWDTDPELARALVRWSGAGVTARRILEPSAGIGNIAVELLRALRPGPGHVLSRTRLDCVEFDPARAALLRERLCDVADPQIDWTVRGGDFLELSPPDSLYDLAVGNPPFAKNGEVVHLTHAARFAARVAFVVRLESLGSAARIEAWEALRVHRLGVLYPRPPFGGSGGGMHEIAFVEASSRWGMPRADSERCALEWVRWRELGAPWGSR